jgi:predicted metal-binding protein
MMLSVCVTCRDRREKWVDEMRPGARFAEAIAAALDRRKDALPPLCLSRVICMSQCDRPCVVALTVPAAFICIFGGLDPDRQADEVLDMVAAYAASPEEFMASARRLDPVRADRLRFLFPRPEGKSL